MPLLDHFRTPIYPTWPWESFHATWSSEIMTWLNRRVLPPGYLATSQVHVSNRIEVDVATSEHDGPTAAGGNVVSGGVATVPWSPPAAPLTMTATFPEFVEVQIRDTAAGSRLVAAIELVSPRNKDRADARASFTAKCASLLHEGIGLIVVDIVTTRQFNLHDELVRLLGLGAPYLLPSNTSLYAVAYKPLRRDPSDGIDIWPFALALGQPLPELPLGLRGGPFVRVDLDATYTEARLRSRL